MKNRYTKGMGEWERSGGGEEGNRSREKATAEMTLKESSLRCELAFPNFILFSKPRFPHVISYLENRNTTCTEGDAGIELGSPSKYAGKYGL